MFSNLFGRQKISNRGFQRNEKDFILNVLNSWEVWANGRNESCSQTEYIDLHQLEKLELLLVQSCRKCLQVMLFLLLDDFSVLPSFSLLLSFLLLIRMFFLFSASHSLPGPSFPLPVPHHAFPSTLPFCLFCCTCSLYFLSHLPFSFISLAASFCI